MAISILGDWNPDGFINFKDAYLKVRVVLGIETSSRVVESGDLNHDDVVDINNIQKIVNLVSGE